MDFNFFKLIDKLYSVSSPFRRDVHYGRSKIIRKIAKYPFPLPINIIIEHGVDAVQIDLFEQKSRPNGYAVYSNKKAEDLRKLGKDNVIQIPDPFTYVVNDDFKYLVNQVKTDLYSGRNKKLIFFYAHSTKSVVDERNSEEYFDVIRSYQKKYQVTVCLHFSDVQRGIGGLLSKALIEWITIPQYPRSKFPYKFFEMVKNFDYAASTIPGSYLYYCIYVGIPFELVNLRPKLKNLTDKAQRKDFVGFFDEYPNSIAYELFCKKNKPLASITKDQKDFVLELLGYEGGNFDSGVVVKKIRKILWSSLIWKR